MDPLTPVKKGVETIVIRVEADKSAGVVEFRVCAAMYGEGGTPLGVHSPRYPCTDVYLRQDILAVLNCWMDARVYRKHEYSTPIGEIREKLGRRFETDLEKHRQYVEPESFHLSPGPLLLSDGEGAEDQHGGSTPISTGAGDPPSDTSLDDVHVSYLLPTEQRHGIQHKLLRERTRRRLATESGARDSDDESDGGGE